MAERSTRARLQEIAAASGLQLALEDDGVVLANVPKDSNDLQNHLVEYDAIPQDVARHRWRGELHQRQAVSIR